MKSARNILHLGLGVHQETIALSLARQLSLRTPGTNEPKPERFSPPTFLTQPTVKIFTQPRAVLGHLIVRHSNKGSRWLSPEWPELKSTRCGSAESQTSPVM